jgi:hypothetical protein
MMEHESSLVVSRKMYLEKTPHRAAGIIRDVSAMQLDLGNFDRLLRQLREQAEAGRRAGYEGIVHLCQSMENCITRITGNFDNPRLETVISTLKEACQVMLRHAEITAASFRPCIPCDVLPVETCVNYPLSAINT